MTAAERLELIKEAQAGSAEALERLVKGNKKLVWHLLKRYKVGKEDEEDLFQVGCIGLIKAIKDFNFDYGVSFSTYAVPKISGELLRYMRDFKPLKVPRPILDLASKIRINELFDFTVEEIMKELELPEESKQLVVDTLEYLEGAATPVSVDKAINMGSDGNSLSLGETISGDVNGDWRNSLEIQNYIDRLSERQAKVVRDFFFEDKTQQVIADELGVTQVHISRLIKKSLETLKVFMTAKEEVVVKEDVLKPHHKAKGDRDKAIELLKSTTKPYKEISELTGVPFGSIGYLALKYRSKDVAEKNRQKGLNKGVERMLKKAEKKKVDKKAKQLKEEVKTSLSEAVEQPMSIQAMAKEAAEVVKASRAARDVKANKRSTVENEGLKTSYKFEVYGKDVSKKEALASLKEISDVLERVESETVSIGIQASV